MVSGKSIVAAEKERKAEYEDMRRHLMQIATGENTNDHDRVHAIEVVMAMDRYGVPPVYSY